MCIKKYYKIVDPLVKKIHYDMQIFCDIPLFDPFKLIIFPSLINFK